MYTHTYVCVYISMSNASQIVLNEAELRDTDRHSHWSHLIAQFFIMNKQVQQAKTDRNY